MYEFHPYFTNDGSVGLYSPEFDDIYHSATGALSEAREKFSQPINLELIAKKDSIKVLDICYGLGYNTKSFLDLILKFFKTNSSHANPYHETIYTNKIHPQKEDNYTEKIYTDNNSNYDDMKCEIHDYQKGIGAVHSNNKFPKIYIKAIDNDKILTYLSPFIKTHGKIPKVQKFDFQYDKIQKYLKTDQNLTPAQLNPMINYFLLDKLLNSHNDILSEEDIDIILFDKRYKKFLEPNLCLLYKFYQKTYDKHYQMSANHLYLHNIYYQYISNRYKRRLKSSILADIDFELVNNDARAAIIYDNNQYDLIFLDAFTPSKCPCLWSYEFFKLLYEHLSADGMILTYSTSASIRGAIVEAGFEIGNIYNESENRLVGTLAVKNKSLIKYSLSEFDLGLLKTKAGIFYRDENLTSLNEAIIEVRNLEIKNSNRISSSQYKKSFTTLENL